jgi:alginate O-acetyltransferase complex protein AlgI
MLFNSWTFAVFLAIVLPLYYYLDWRRQNIFLLAASYLFYGWWDWRFLILLMLSTVVDFFVAKGMTAASDLTRRRQLMAMSVSLNLIYLGFFKYFNFFIGSLKQSLALFGLPEPDGFTLNVILPVGISFYTFQSISYIVDVYRNSREHTDDFIAFALYLAYFPHLVAGPIQRSTQLLPQLLESRRVSLDQISSGVVLMMVGFFKKIAIADAVAPAVNRIFSDPSSASVSSNLLNGMYLFAIQIYCDFSGYTDIARGVSRLMGIELRLNFRQPYLSANITEFWRKWHISLSDWLRDYVYISLGGNRKGSWRTYGNLMATMLLGGFWHGAGWNFIIWGGLHGFYLAVHRALSATTRRAGQSGRPTTLLAWTRYAFSVCLTFHLVCLTWIFFRAADLKTALAYFAGLFRSLPTAQLSTQVIVYLSLVFLLDFSAWYQDEEQPISTRWATPIRGIAYGVMIAICLWVGANESSSFIYFQF